MELPQSYIGSNFLVAYCILLENTSCDEKAQCGGTAECECKNLIEIFHPIGDAIRKGM